MPLIGDGNAVGFCETFPWESSLRKALSEQFHITVTAKPVTSWKTFARYVHNTLSQFAQEASRKTPGTTGSGAADALTLGHVDTIVFVLGANDVLAGSARAETWSKLATSFQTVIMEAQRYSKKSNEQSTTLTDLGRLCTHGQPESKGTLLLIGDGNAVGACETSP